MSDSCLRPKSCSAVLAGSVFLKYFIQVRNYRIIFRNLVQIIRGKLDVDIQLKNQDYYCNLYPSQPTSLCPSPATPNQPPIPYCVRRNSEERKCTPLIYKRRRCSHCCRPHECVFVYQVPPPCRKTCKPYV